MFKITSLLIIIFGISFQISAQCGVYFKETSRQILSNAITESYFEDIDNDGLDDLIGYSTTALSSSGTNYQIYFYKRTSVNSFDTTAKISTVENVSSDHRVFGDVNADGKKDLIIARSNPTRTLYVYLNDGTGVFSNPQTSTLNSFGSLEASVDLNGDNRADIITSSYNGSNSTSTLYYHLAQPDNTYGEQVSIGNFSSFTVSGAGFMSAGNYPVLVRGIPLIVQDFNNDGLKDIALTAGNYPLTNLVVITNNGNLTFSAPTSASFFNSPSKLKTADLNNDGKLDFISAPNPNTGAIRVAVNNGDNTFTTQTRSIQFSHNEISYIGKNFSVKDMDNDGDADILYPIRTKYVLLENQGNATFAVRPVNNLITIDEDLNLDNDGKMDAIVFPFAVIDGGYSLPEPDGSSNRRYFNLFKSVSFRKNVCNPAGQTKLVDFDGDGNVNRAFWNPANGNWRHYLANDQFNTTQVNYEWGLGSFQDVPVPNDYDGDGKTDYAVYRKSNGTWWIYQSSNQGYRAFQFGLPEDKPVPADYDGDGKADVAVYRPSTGVWYFWLSQTDQFSGYQWGVAEDKPVPADYDGDGKADIAVYRPSVGVWFKLNSSDFSYSVVQYGISSDIPIPGDYDANGKANITIFRDGIWYVLRDDFSTSYINWGTAGDIPFFNDSLLPTVGVYRASSSAVYLTHSTIIYGGGAAALPTGNSAGEIFVSSILPPQ